MEPTKNFKFGNFDSDSISYIATSFILLVEYNSSENVWFLCKTFAREAALDLTVGNSLHVLK